MYPAIDNPASCEIRTVIRFFHSKSMSTAEIHRELCMPVYVQNIISEGTVRQWCRMFKESTSQFPKFYMNFHRFHALFSMKLSQLG
jgi:hypothetical protein